MVSKQMKCDGSLFIIRKDKDGSLVIILVNVDDFLSVGNSKSTLEAAVKHFLEKFEGTFEPLLSWYLGVRIQITPARCFVSQSANITQIINEYRFQNVKAYPTRMNAKFYEQLEKYVDDPI